MSTKRKGVPEFEKADLDEPVFVLRAQDVIAPVIIELYALHYTSLPGKTQQKVDSIRECAHAMRVWQQTNGCKVPD